MSTFKETQAIVCGTPREDGSSNWKMEKLRVREIGENELVVRIVASGVCHTDLLAGSVPSAKGGRYPRVLGHEGAGIVVEVGSKVDAKPGDSVLLSFAYCGSCEQCSAKHPAYCESFVIANYVGSGGVFKSFDGTDVAGTFFGQSSFSNLTTVAESSIVNVSRMINSEDELKLFAPLGCGLQTGAATVIKLCKATSSDTVVITGLGAIGLAAIMAAKIAGCKSVVGIDRVESRLKLAIELGATAVINTSDVDMDVGAEVKKLLNGGPSIAIDATGHLALIKQAYQFTGRRGKLVVVGAPGQDAKLEVPLGELMGTGKTLTASVKGDATPSEFLPQMIKWYREGNFPFEKLVQYFPAERFEDAIAGMKSGAVIKPILVW